MYGTIKDLFGAGKDARSLIREIRSEKRNTKGLINAILAETEHNMSLILDHYVITSYSIHYTKLYEA